MALAGSKVVVARTSRMPCAFLSTHALLGSVVHAVHERDLGQTEVVAGVVADLDRPWRGQFQAIGGPHDVDLGRLIAFDHDAMGALLAHRPTKKGQQATPGTRSVLVDAPAWPRACRG
jgi:hypothetical protein